VLDAYRRDPSDLYLLRIGYGGTMGAISGIDQEGFASAAFHSYPDMMKFDPYTGDYGPNFFGHAWNTATYVTRDAEFGWLAFGGNLKAKGGRVSVEPRDSFRQRVYLAPLGLWLTLDSGRFEQVTLDEVTSGVEVRLAPGDAYTATALLRVEQPANLHGVDMIAPQEKLTMERGAYVVPLGKTSVTVRLSAQK
jgi:hypothetical protein